MVKRRKRAFTITELVIVIAVVAILAAVLIPTFTNVINRAEESADTQTVKNINEILNAEEIIDGKPATMHEAMLVIREGGYNVENLSPTRDGYDIVWDEKNNRLALLDGENVVFGDDAVKSTPKEKIWKVTDKAPEDDGYSYYLSPSFSGNEVKAYAGLDVGENKDIASVEILSSAKTGSQKEILVRTNGGELTVNAPEYTVTHYDAAENVDILAVADNSYHEYGTVAEEVKLIKGRLVLENGAQVNMLSLAPVGDKAEDIAVNMSAGATLTSVSANNAGILNSENVKLLGNVEEVIVSDSTKNLFAGGLGTERNPYQISNPQQLLNIGELSESMKANNAYHFVLTADINLAEIAQQVKTDEPRGVTYLLQEINGSLDGNGHTVSGYNGLNYIFEYALQGAEFRNVAIKWDDTNITRIVYNTAVFSSPESSEEDVNIQPSNMTFENVDYIGQTGVTYYIGDDNAALYFNGRGNKAYCCYESGYFQPDAFVSMDWMLGGWTQNFILHECDVTATLAGGNGENGAAVFLGGGLSFCNESISLIDCSFTGTLTGKNVAVIYAQADTAYSSDIQRTTVENLIINGSICSLGGTSGITFASIITGMSGGQTTYENAREHEHPAIAGGNYSGVYFDLSDSYGMSVSAQNGEQYQFVAPTISVPGGAIGYYEVKLYLPFMRLWEEDYSAATGYANANASVTIRVEDLSELQLYKSRALTVQDAREKWGTNALKDVQWQQSTEGYRYSFYESAGAQYLIVDGEAKGIYGKFDAERYVWADVFAFTENGTPICYATDQI